MRNDKGRLRECRVRANLQNVKKELTIIKN